MYSPYIPYVIDAVYSVAHALDYLTKRTDMTDKCGHEYDITHIDMQKPLRRVNFYGLTGKIKFNQFGDRDAAFYDIKISSK